MKTESRKMCHQNFMESTTSGTDAGLGNDQGFKGNLY